MPIGTTQWWPPHMLRAVSSSFMLGSINGAVQPIFQAAPSVFADPFEQRWTCTFQSPPLGEQESTDARGNVRPSFREVEGRIAKLRGMAGAIRLWDPFNKDWAYNIEVAPTLTDWSDGTTWSDGTEWAGGFLPPFVTVDEAAVEGAESIVIKGLPASILRVGRIGDRFEAIPNGIRPDWAHYYGAVDDCTSNASGKTRVYFQPGLRGPLNPGDMIRLKYPTTVMRMIDDRQGEVQRGLVTGSFGVTLLESLRSD
jgi:hypothetical protein